MAVLTARKGKLDRTGFGRQTLDSGRHGPVGLMVDKALLRLCGKTGSL